MRKMRRSDRQTSTEDAYKFLNQADYGTLSTISEEGYPHAVALNHVYYNNYIYVHCAKTGFKIDNIDHNNNVCFSVVAHAEVDQANYTTKYKSTIVYGKAYIVEDKKETKEALYQLSKRHVGKFISKVKAEIASAINKTYVIRIAIEDIKGKSNI